MSAETNRSAPRALPPKEAQEALAEALEAELEAVSEVDADSDMPEGEASVVSLPAGDDSGEDGFDLFDGEENPFAAAAEFASHVRMTEALLFAAAEPLDEATIADRLPGGAAVKDILETLQQQYENRGILLRKFGRKWQFVTDPSVAHVLEKEQVQPRKLSRAALETLAIIAYHQPCSRAEIEEIRGVAVSKGSLDLLMEIGWLRLRGRRKDVPGRPLLYGTSQEFLEHFGLESVSHLPGMADLKAAGLLEARLPPGFSVPVPSDASEIDGCDDEPEETDFVQAFHEDETTSPEDAGDALTELVADAADEDETPPVD